MKSKKSERERSIHTIKEAQDEEELIAEFSEKKEGQIGTAELKDEPVPFLSRLEIEKRAVQEILDAAKPIFQPWEEEQGSFQLPNVDLTADANTLKERHAEISRDIGESDTFFKAALKSALEAATQNAKDPGHLLSWLQEIRPRLVYLFQVNEHLSNLRSLSYKIEEAFDRTRRQEEHVGNDEEVRNEEMRFFQEAREMEQDYHGFGRLFHRRSIRAKRTEANRLLRIQSSTRLPPIPYLDTTPEKQMSDPAGEVAAVLVAEIQRRFDPLLAEQENITSPDLSLDPATIDQMNDAFFDRFIVPSLEKRFRKFNAEEQLTQQTVQQAKDLIRRATSLSKNPSDLETTLRAKEFRQEIESMPYDAREILHQIVQQSEESKDHPYDIFIEMTREASLITRNLAFEKYQNALHQCGLFLRHYPNTFYGKKPLEVQNIIDAKDRSLSHQHDSLRIDKLPYKWWEKCDSRRWPIFRDHPDVQKTLGDSTINTTEEIMAGVLAHELLVNRDRREEMDKIAESLCWIGGTRHLPLLILGAIPQPDHGTQRTFFDRLKRGSSLNDVLQTLSPDDLKQPSKRNIPGLVPLIELIQRNPDALQRLIQYDATKGEEVMNPDWQEAQQAILEIAKYQLEQPNHDFRLFSLRALQGGFGDFGKIFPILQQFLEDQNDGRHLIKKLSVSLLENLLHRRDPDAAKLLLRHYQSQPESQKDLIRTSQEVVFEFAPDHDSMDPGLRDLVANVLGQSAEAITATMRFLNSEAEFASKDLSFFSRYCEIANSPELLDFFADLKTYGYIFLVGHVEALKALLPNKEALLNDLQTIRKTFPRYRYEIRFTSRLNEGDRFATDPYILVISQFPPEIVWEGLGAMYAQDGRIHPQLALGYQHFLRQRNPLLRGDESAFDRIPVESEEQFLRAIQRILEARAGASPMEWEIYVQAEAQSFLARQPEKIQDLLDLPKKHPDLIRLLDVGGPLHQNRDQTLRMIFENGNPNRRAFEIETNFSRGDYAEQLYYFTEARVGTALAACTVQYPISEVAGIPLANLIERHRSAKAQNPDRLTRLESVIDVQHRDSIPSLLSGERTTVPFSSLTGMMKRLIFRDRLIHTIQTSRSKEAHRAADERNRALAANPIALHDRMYLHGSPVEHLGSVLLNGNLPQEALGEAAGTDSYPFHVDFTKILLEHLKDQKTARDIFQESLSAGYGNRGRYGTEGQLFYVYDRSHTSWDEGKELVTHPGGNHALTLAGMPSSEICAIALTAPTRTLDMARSGVLEYGAYIPIYSVEGELLLTPQQYDEEREALNLDVPVETWGYALRSGDALGSNPGGTFTVPSAHGSEQYYVKFSHSSEEANLWNEQLADNLYRRMGFAVPKTKVVRTEGSLGHASQWVPGRFSRNMEELEAGLQSGFLTDCWLANWDVAAKTDNAIIGEDARFYRIDNGGALLFRAQGERKTAFSETVTELETMRGSYPPFSPEDLSSFLEAFRSSCTDAMIDEEIEKVRLPKTERQTLKLTLRRRRDYILLYYEKTIETRELPESAKTMIDLLRQPEFDHAEISRLLPEWEKLQGENGYQHNGVLLGEHLEEAVRIVQRVPEFQSLTPHEQRLAVLATLFHDIAKPTGRRDERVRRDFDHEIPSAELAATTLQRWGVSPADIQAIAQVITHDGVVSDIARKKVRDPRKNVTPEAFQLLIPNMAVRKILRAVNRADVVATVGEQGFRSIQSAYDSYFDQLLQ